MEKNHTLSNILYVICCFPCLIYTVSKDKLPITLTRSTKPLIDIETLHINPVQVDEDVESTPLEIDQYV